MIKVIRFQSINFSSKLDDKRLRVIKFQFVVCKEKKTRPLVTMVGPKQGF